MSEHRPTDANPAKQPQPPAPVRPAPWEAKMLRQAARSCPEHRPADQCCRRGHERLERKMSGALADAIARARQRWQEDDVNDEGAGEAAAPQRTEH